MKTIDELLELHSKAHDEAMTAGATPTTAINQSLAEIYKAGMHDAGGGFQSEDEATAHAQRYLEEHGYAVVKAPIGDSDADVCEAAIALLQFHGYYVVKEGGLYIENCRKALESAGYTVAAPITPLASSSGPVRLISADRPE